MPKSTGADAVAATLHAMLHATVHVELVAQTPTALGLRLWRDDRNAAPTHPLPPGEIDDLVARAEADYYGAPSPKLAEIGRRLFRWLDGDERRLTQAIAESRGEAPVLVLAIETPERLAHLPWELLHDGTTFLVLAANPPVVPVRRHAASSVAREPQNRPLQALFMASSPRDVEPVLDYEGEEASILAATARHPLDLVVEESGCLEELGALVQDYGRGTFDVMHFTGHADHAADDTPIFVLEDTAGERADHSADDFARAISYRPRLLFLSGCRTGQNAAHGEVGSLAGKLVDAGFPAVLGWGRPVRDSDATTAATTLYEALSAGMPLPLALARTYAALHDDGARDWHLLRLFCAGDPPGALVVPPRAPGRKRFVAPPSETAFLDPVKREVKVAARADFVGRRRLLQRGIRSLRTPADGRVGLLLHGQGGRGKSSVAARLCDRLRNEYGRVVVIGRLDEPAFVNAWADALPDDAMRQALREPSTPLRDRVRATLAALADAGERAPLFVLDDFEQNQPDAAHGDLQLASHAAPVLGALLDALASLHDAGRVLITDRYALPAAFARHLDEADVAPLDATERHKQSLRLDHRAARQLKDASLLAQADIAADGNPRLFRWLHEVLERPGLDHAAILAAMAQVEEKFRENILARHLIASLSDEDRTLLGRMLLLRVPVPLSAVRALDGRDEGALRPALERAGGLSLVDVTEEDGATHYRVPRQLAGGDPPLLVEPDDDERVALCGALFDVLHDEWWTRSNAIPESRMLELIQLAANGERRSRLKPLARTLTSQWLRDHRYTETAALLKAIIDPAGRPPALLADLGRATRVLGDGAMAGDLLREAVAGSENAEDADRGPILYQFIQWLAWQGQLDEVVRIGREQLVPLLERIGEERGRAATLSLIAAVLQARGELDEVLRIRREDLLPVFERLGDVRSRAIALAQIADVLLARGDLDDALRMFREELLPTFERLGDVRSQAVTQGRIADILQARGGLDEALRIRREEQLPVFERLGDARERAITLGKIADVLEAHGAFDDALRIRREEELPVYERLGDVRLRAVTLGMIAAMLQTRGQIDEALRLHREEELPVYERLGDVRSLLVTRTNIALLLVRRQREEDVPEIIGHLLWSYQAARTRGYQEAAQIAEICRQIGLPLPEDE